MITPVADHNGPPCLSSSKAQASRSEVGGSTQVHMGVVLIDDNAYDSVKLCKELNRYGIELVAPHRSQ